MKRALLAFAMAVTLVSWGSWAWAGIQHTVHNLQPSSNAGRWKWISGAWTFEVSATPDDGTTPEICIYCHTPHQSSSELSVSITGDGAPIWNRVLSTASYQMYSSPTFNSATDPAPTGVSKACLSCHDGTVGINQLVNNRGSGLGTNPANAGDTKITNAPAELVPNLGTDLRNDHPISMLYSAARSPNGSYQTFAQSGSDAAPTDPLSGFYDPGASQRFANGIRLYNGKVQCASHHDPHNSGNPTFLRVSNDASAVCLTCHRKDN